MKTATPVAIVVAPIVLTEKDETAFLTHQEAAFQLGNLKEWSKYEGLLLYENHHVTKSPFMMENTKKFLVFVSSMLLVL